MKQLVGDASYNDARRKAGKGSEDAEGDVRRCMKLIKSTYYYDNYKAK